LAQTGEISIIESPSRGSYMTAEDQRKSDQLEFVNDPRDWLCIDQTSGPYRKEKKTPKKGTRFRS